jgi:hypothetical protein
VLGLVPIVRAAFDRAVLLRGLTTVGVWPDVVDVAVVGRFVTAGGVLAVAVTDLDGPAQRAGEAATAGHSDDPVGPVEHDPFDVGLRQPLHDLAGSDDGAVGQLAQVSERGLADEDGDQWARPESA